MSTPITRPLQDLHPLLQDLVHHCAEQYGIAVPEGVRISLLRSIEADAFGLKGKDLSVLAFRDSRGDVVVASTSAELLMAS